MFGNIYQNKRVLITGNTGFKGAWLSIWLHKLGAQVHGISNAVPTEPSMFDALQLSDIVTYHCLDVRDLDQLSKTYSSIQPDFVFHLAAQPIVSTSYADPTDTFSTNVMGTCNIMEAVRRSNVPCRLIMITSDKAYENVEWTWGYRENDRLGGKDPYSASKGAAEIAIHSFYHSFFRNEDSLVSIASVRAGNVIGGGDWADNRIVPDCVRAWSKGETVSIRSPKATRPWQHVLEPLSGYLRMGQVLWDNPQLSGESYNFGPPPNQNHTVLELLEEIAKYWDFGQQTKVFDINVQGNFHEAGLLKLNCDKALHELEWKASLNFPQTARFTSEWYDEFYHKGPGEMLAFTKAQLQEYEEIAAKHDFVWTKSLQAVKG